MGQVSVTGGSVYIASTYSQPKGEFKPFVQEGRFIDVLGCSLHHEPLCISQVKTAILLGLLVRVAEINIFWHEE